MASYDVAVIGGGIVGAAVSFELACCGVRVAVLEAERSPGLGVSCSNSGIVHMGFDSPRGDFETSMILAQSRRWRSVFDDMGIPYRNTGAIMIARSEEDEEAVSALHQNARQNSVETILLETEELRELEPHAPGLSGMLIPGESITDPYEAVRRLLTAGQTVTTDFRVCDVKSGVGWISVGDGNREVEARFAVNCAGLFADEIADDEFTITPRRGEFIVYPPDCASLVRHILLPVPNTNTKGVLVFPTLFGNVCVGPTAEDQEDKNDWSSTPKAIEMLREKAAIMLPALKDIEPVTSWTGLRTVGHPRNYYLEFSDSKPNLLHVAGIRSTGLSGCLGLSLHVLGMLAGKGLSTQRYRLLREPIEIEAKPWWERLREARA